MHFKAVAIRYCCPIQQGMLRWDIEMSLTWLWETILLQHLLLLIAWCSFPPLPTGVPWAIPTAVSPMICCCSCSHLCTLSTSWPFYLMHWLICTHSSFLTRDNSPLHTDMRHIPVRWDSHSSCCLWCLPAEKKSQKKSQKNSKAFVDSLTT